MILLMYPPEAGEAPYSQETKKALRETMSDEDELADLEQRMRAKLHAPKQAFSATVTHTAPQALKEPLPRKIVVERLRDWGNVADSRQKPNAAHWRWFLYALQENGSRKQILDTTSEMLAKQEVNRYRKLGVEMEVLKEH
ncbi:hypothetical protein CYK37_11890 [Mesorhizobium loti]|nr:hypothetical protein CYK37_11890 [Mesorhizobium loti]